MAPSLLTSARLAFVKPSRVANKANPQKIVSAASKSAANPTLGNPDSSMRAPSKPAQSKPATMRPASSNAAPRKPSSSAPTSFSSIYGALTASLEASNKRNISKGISAFTSRNQDVAPASQKRKREDDASSSEANKHTRVDGPTTTEAVRALAKKDNASPSEAPKAPIKRKRSENAATPITTTTTTTTTAAARSPVTIRRHQNHAANAQARSARADAHRSPPLKRKRDEDDVVPVLVAAVRATGKRRRLADVAPEPSYRHVCNRGLLNTSDARKLRRAASAMPAGMSARRFGIALKPTVKSVLPSYGINKGPSAPAAPSPSLRAAPAPSSQSTRRPATAAGGRGDNQLHSTPPIKEEPTTPPRHRPRITFKERAAAARFGGQITRKIIDDRELARTQREVESEHLSEMMKADGMGPDPQISIDAKKVRTRRRVTDGRIRWNDY
ncbi:uncharacterized protein K452DRAFT_301588 [Aplosporella prunicola CBS 121167]|uniref:Uncharacterized protein n=1 Tax=Aplosporella prunicola CBS 121167 TaxID=1176127 RepID=A0A6A6B121_9PEZI|nr:uncharacterized protein K452DRAFT_301588 [Aplosporella prunicola CBS 121167]KAF2137859.1 hypothetical protein K452DRAFT_301588 [Aplosporella prunicola CBS 121167]